MWVRAVPEGDEVVLTIERWDLRPPLGPRLASVGGGGGQTDPLSSSGRWSVDEQLRIVGISDPAAELIGASAAEASGQLLTRLVKLEEDEEGECRCCRRWPRAAAFHASRCAAEATTRRCCSVARSCSAPETASPVSKVRSRKPISPKAQEPVERDPAFDELLRSPLRHIIDSADRITRRSDGPLRDDYAAYAAVISAAAHYLLSVVGSMGEDAAAGRATIDLVDLVYEAVGLIETAASEREIAVAVEPLHSFTAHGEARGVIQILVNLIGNAVRHSSVRATVTISFERSAGHSIVHVADDGPGIDPADQQRIFERFQRGTGEGQGSGLGLAIARRLAQSMDGDIQLHSRPGMGSRFSLVLPAA